MWCSSGEGLVVCDSELKLPRLSRSGLIRHQKWTVPIPYWVQDKFKYIWWGTFTHCLLIHTHCLLIHTHCLLIHTHCLLIHTHCLLIHTHCLLIHNHCLLVQIHSLLIYTHSLLLHTHCLLIYNHCLLIHTHCLLLPTPSGAVAIFNFHVVLYILRHPGLFHDASYLTVKRTIQQIC